MIPRSILMTTDTVRGVWEVNLELARGLSDHGVEVHLAASGGLPADKQRHDAQTIPNLVFYPTMLLLEWMDDPWEDIKINQRRVEDIADTVNPDLVHFSEFTLANDRHWHHPSVMVAHGDLVTRHRALFGEDPGDSLAEYHRRVGDGLRAASKVTAPSAWMLQQLRDTYGDFAAASPIPHGRDASLYDPAAERDEVVLFAGTLWDEAKNISALDRAAAELPWPVRLAGARMHPGGGHRAEVDHAERLGMLNQDELRERMNRAAIYALPSRYEPFGYTALEAALGGCALVLADLPPLREIWPEDAAAWVDPTRPDTVTRAIAELIDNPARRESLAARSRAVAKDYTRERMTKRYLDLYAEVLVQDVRRVS